MNKVIEQLNELKKSLYGERADENTTDIIRDGIDGIRKEYRERNPSNDVQINFILDGSELTFITSFTINYKL